LTRHGGSEKYNAVIVGGSIGALVAAAYLARAKARVALFDAGEHFGGDARTLEFAPGFRAPLLSHTAFAIDGRAVRELRLTAYGLEFAQANMKLVALGPGGKHVVLPGESFRGRAALAANSGPEGLAYAAFHDEVMRLARLMRPLWDGTLAEPAGPNAAETLATAIRRLRLEDRDAERIEELSRLSAAAFLDRWFENGAVRDALAFDVFPSGLSPQEAGSALVLIWRYAQECGGPQGAVGQIRGGPGVLAAALTVAAREAGAELFPLKRVSSIAGQWRDGGGGCRVVEL
jgi:phytoene dehydrogenase-like protein